eukprot:83011-Chlamydomonas_euryale.AAC.3
MAQHPAPGCTHLLLLLDLPHLGHVALNVRRLSHLHGRVVATRGGTHAHALRPWWRRAGDGRFGADSCVSICLAAKAT